MWCLWVFGAALYVSAGVLLAALVADRGWDDGRMDRWVGDSTRRALLAFAIWPVSLTAAVAAGAVTEGSCDGR
jgi:hypothetical protein